MMRQMACIWDGDQNGSWNGQTGLAFDYECTASDTKERMSSNFLWSHCWLQRRVFWFLIVASSFVETAHFQNSLWHLAVAFEDFSARKQCNLASQSCSQRIQTWPQRDHTARGYSSPKVPCIIAVMFQGPFFCFCCRFRCCLYTVALLFNRLRR